MSKITPTHATLRRYGDMWHLTIRLPKKGYRLIALGGDCKVLQYYLEDTEKQGEPTEEVVWVHLPEGTLNIIDYQYFHSVFRDHLLMVFIPSEKITPNPDQIFDVAEPI